SPSAPAPQALPTIEPPAPSSNGNSAPGALDLGAVVRAWDQIAALLNAQPMGRTLAAQMAEMLMAWPARAPSDTILIGPQRVAQPPPDSTTPGAADEDSGRPGQRDRQRHGQRRGHGDDDRPPRGARGQD